MVSKEVARDLRKYKFNLAKTPNKENRKPSLERTISPATRRLNFGSPAKDKAPDNTHEVREMLKMLDGGVHDKVQMLKSLASKCSEADVTYKKIRQHMIKGDITQAERLVSMLEQMNSSTLKELQNQVSSSPDVFDLIAQLGDQV